MMKKFLLLIVLLTLPLTFSGCFLLVAGAAAGTGVMYAKGDLEAALDENLDDVYQASTTAMDELQLMIVSKTKDMLEAEIIGRTSQDKKITIKIRKEGENLTKLSIRVGTFGDEAQSQAIYDKIRKNL